MQPIIATGYVKDTHALAENRRSEYWHDIICDEFVRLDCACNAEAFAGQLRGGVGFSDVSFAEVLADPQVVTRSKRKIASATEEFFLVSFQVESRGAVRQNGREAVLMPGMFAMYDSTQPYSLHFEERFHQLVVQMPKAVLHRHLSDAERYTAVAIDGRGGLGSVVSQFLFSVVREVQELDRHPDELSDSLVNLMAMALSSSVMLNVATESQTAADPIKRRVRSFVDNSLSDPNLSNERIAAAQGISVRYLHKLFQDEPESLHQYVLRRRLELAGRLLRDAAYADTSVERIAYSVGFASSGHFSRVFKSRFGCTPGQYRSG